MARWRSDLTDEQRAALDQVFSVLPDGSYPITRDAVRAAFAAPEPRTREGWIAQAAFDDDCPEGMVGCFLWMTPQDHPEAVHVLMIAIPADADAAAVERVRRAAIEAMP